MSRSLLFASRHDSLAFAFRRPRAPTFWGHVRSVFPAVANPPRTFSEKLGSGDAALDLSTWCLGEFGQCRGKVFVDEAAEPAVSTSVATTAVAAAATGIRPKRHPRSDMRRD
jgi:hypothetical protein